MQGFVIIYCTNDNHEWKVPAIFSAVENLATKSRWWVFWIFVPFLQLFCSSPNNFQDTLCRCGILPAKQHCLSFSYGLHNQLVYLRLNWCWLRIWCVKQKLLDDWFWLVLLRFLAFCVVRVSFQTTGQRIRGGDICVWWFTWKAFSCNTNDFAYSCLGIGDVE